MKVDRLGSGAWETDSATDDSDSGHAVNILDGDNETNKGTEEDIDFIILFWC